MPVAADQRALRPKQIYHRRVLPRVQLIRILDPELRLVFHQIKGGVGDVDRTVIGLNPSLVALAVGKGLLLEHDRPALRRLFEDFGIVGKHVGSPLIGDAVVNAVDCVPRCILEPLVDAAPAWDQVGIDGLNLPARNQAQRRIARGRDKVESALSHQRDHRVRRRRGLNIDLAARFLLESGDPVIIFVGLAALDIAGPGNDIELALALADSGRHLCKPGAAKSKHEKRGGGDTQCWLHAIGSRNERAKQTERHGPSNPLYRRRMLIEDNARCHRESRE